ncbi:MAG: WYL domain-containing protein [Oscillospiraceae bacterium]|nr:WYL domain-containing protein [Oscillospiraceae bacterium]
MPRSDNQKLKLLYLKQLLEERSDEEHPLHMQTIIDYLENKGIKAERKSIYSDIACLQDFGMDICIQHGKNGGYYLASRDFELPELKLLVDAVQASKFLTEKKSMALIRKLETLASMHEAGSLRRQVVVSGRVKTMNESIFYSIDLLHDAIAANKQITFRYFDWGVDKQKHFRDGTYTASPFALCWDSENYYLIAHTERHSVTHYRVDKMSNIQQTNQDRIITDELRNIDLSSYGKNVFSMFGGETVQVKLRFENALSGVALDRFGHDVMLIPDGSDHFTCTTPITVSPNFYGWVAGFGGRVQILFPQNVVDGYKALCKQAYEA